MKWAYAVTATLPPELESAYVNWLMEGHVQAVLAGGARSAEITRLAGDSCRIETRYLFDSEQDFTRYDADFAPPLRAEGKARFGDLPGVAFSRTQGSVVGRFAG